MHPLSLSPVYSKINEIHLSDGFDIGMVVNLELAWA
jgi:hypothetical protein